MAAASSSGASAREFLQMGHVFWCPSPDAARRADTPLLAMTVSQQGRGQRGEGREAAPPKAPALSREAGRGRWYGWAVSPLSPEGPGGRLPSPRAERKTFSCFGTSVSSV
jgi:hypothetical protein